MINGMNLLKKMYSQFDDKCYQPDGIDLRLGQVCTLEFDCDTQYGITDTQKILPEHVPMELTKCSLGEGWMLNPYSTYIFEVDRPIHINPNSAQFYLPRSSLLRTGINVITALGDSDFNGTLSFLAVNEANVPLFLEKGVRFAQLIDFNVDEAGLYNGDYQEKHNDKWLKTDRFEF